MKIYSNGHRGSLIIAQILLIVLATGLHSTQGRKAVTASRRTATTRRPSVFTTARSNIRGHNDNSGGFGIRTTPRVIATTPRRQWEPDPPRISQPEHAHYPSLTSSTPRGFTHVQSGGWTPEPPRVSQPEHGHYPSLTSSTPRGVTYVQSGGLTPETPRPWHSEYGNSASTPRGVANVQNVGWVPDPSRPRNPEYDNGPRGVTNVQNVGWVPDPSRPWNPEHDHRPRGVTNIQSGGWTPDPSRLRNPEYDNGPRGVTNIQSGGWVPDTSRPRHPDYDHRPRGVTNIQSGGWTPDPSRPWNPEYDNGPRGVTNTQSGGLWIPEPPHSWRRGYDSSSSIRRNNPSRTHYTYGNTYLRNSACRVRMNGGLPHPQPLILLETFGIEDGLAFKRPAHGGMTGTLHFRRREKVRLACTGENNYFENVGRIHKDINVFCDDNGLFKYRCELHDFSYYRCHEDSKISNRTGNSTFCNGTSDELFEFGFKISEPIHERFMITMENCFNHLTWTTKWTRYDLVSEIQEKQNGLRELTKIRLDDHFEPNDDHFYSRTAQRSALQDIIGQSKAEQYVGLINNDFLLRAQLIPKTDFLYNVQQAATFHFANVAPQWRLFNGETWVGVENNARNFAIRRRTNLAVYTGTYGLATLPDSSGVEQPLHLYINQTTQEKKIPVPAVFWKVLYNPATRKGIALVGINMLHMTWDQVLSAPGVDLCPGKHRESTYWDICRASTPTFQTKGFGYCCDVGDFRSVVNYIPTLQVDGLLE